MKLDPAYCKHPWLTAVNDKATCNLCGTANLTPPDATDYFTMRVREPSFEKSGRNREKGVSPEPRRTRKRSPESH